MPGLKTIIDSLRKNSGNVVVGHVDRMLMRRNEVAASTDNWLHPSALVPWKKGWEHICPRELWYTRFAPIARWPKDLLQDDFTPRFFRIVDNGQWVHRRWQCYLIQAGMTHPELGVGWEVPVQDPELGLLGHADAIVYPEAAGVNRVEIEFYDHGVPKYTKTGGFVYRILSNNGRWQSVGTPVLIDVKSIKDFYWQSLQLAPQPEHQVQITCYLALLKLLKCHFLYECKNTQEVKEIVFRLDKDRWAFFRKVLLDVKYAHQHKFLPPRICRSGVVARAQECPWVDVCFKHKTYEQLVQIKEKAHT